MPDKPQLAVSKTSIEDYRRCQQLYSYRYVQRLRPHGRALAPELGTILAEYLRHYYLRLAEDKPQDAHAQAQLAISTSYMPTIQRFVRQAQEAGLDELAVDLKALPAKAARISERYFNVRGRQDAERYEILLAEEFLSIRISKSIVSNGRVDLVTRDRDKGIIRLWEHKSTVSVPDMMVRLRDLQTILYKHKVERLELIDGEIDAIVWNYFRTVEPVEPHVLKNGQLSKAISTDTTWEVYSAALKRQGLALADYDDMKQKLEGRELSAFFPRFDQAVVSDADVLYRDYVQTAKEIFRSRAAWNAGEREPVRTLSRDCNFCEMAPLCNAALLAGDDSDVISLRYTVGT